jgi:predicted GNAT family acetyltransferase
MAEAERDDIRVVDAPDASRFEVFVSDELAGYVTYRRDADRIVFMHTEVFDKWEGHGIGSRLARGVLDDARANGRRVETRCEFIAGYVEDHPEYADLLA